MDSLSVVEKPDFGKIISYTNESPVADTAMVKHTISVAPMLDITNRYFRFFYRMLTRHTVLWTEMLHENSIIHSKLGSKGYLKYFPIENPLVCQLGGNDPEKLALCAKICEEMGYSEVNLNVGCPSDRVQSGAFGACLMKDPELVAKIMKKMNDSVNIPCTVKCRLGVDDFDSYEFASNFVKTVSEKGDVKHFIVHARKAFLKGLNPAQNRNIPPLKYDYVLQLKKDFPQLDFSINGGFKTTEQIQGILVEENGLAGCMLGRKAYDDPWQFGDYDRVFYGQKNPGLSRREILENWADFGEYVMKEENPMVCVPTLVKPIINLLSGQRSNKQYRQFLSDPVNFRKVGNFQDFMYNCIETIDKYNPDVLDQRHPTSE